MGQITICSVQDITAEEYRDIRLHGLQHNQEAFLSTYQELSTLSLQDWEARRERAINDPKSLLLYVRYDGEVVGLCGITCSAKERIQHVAELGMVYLKQEVRGQGIAEAMLKELLHRAPKETPARKIHLTVVATNIPAISLYQKLGFREVGVLEQELLTDGAYTDLRMMEKILI